MPTSTKQALSIHGVVPVIPVQDMEKALDYYRNVLGFHIDFTYGDPPNHASLSNKNKACLHLTVWQRNKTDRKYNRCSETPAQENQMTGWTYLFVSKIDKLYQYYCDQSVRIVTPLTTREWDMREFEIQDIDGNFLRFGQSVLSDKS